MFLLEMNFDKSTIGLYILLISSMLSKFLYISNTLQIHYILYIGLVISLTYIVLIFGLYILMYVLSPISPCVVFFLLYTHVSYIVYAIFYFCFTLRCFDEFCLKCFRNTGCQSLLAINSLLVKFFKSLC